MGWNSTGLNLLGPQGPEGPQGESGTPNSYSTTIGNGAATTIVVTHNLGSEGVLVGINEIASGEVVAADIFITDTNTVTLVFDVAPASNSLAVTVAGGALGVEVADGTLTTAKFTSGTLVTAADTLASNDNDTTIPTSAAVIDAIASGAGGISNVVEDTSPQLGGNLDLNGNAVGVATAADLTKLHAVTADATELNYVDGVTSAIQTQLGNKQPLDADLTTIAGLTATTNNFMVAVSSAWASRTPAQARTTLNVADGATANSSDATLLARANHTGTQSADTITDGTTNKAYTAAEKTKLAGIEAAADVTDATNVAAAGAVMGSGSATGLWIGASLPGSGSTGILYVVT